MEEILQMVVIREEEILQMVVVIQEVVIPRMEEIQPGVMTREVMTKEMTRRAVIQREETPVPVGTQQVVTQQGETLVYPVKMTVVIKHLEPVSNHHREEVRVAITVEETSLRRHKNQRKAPHRVPEALRSGSHGQPDRRDPKHRLHSPRRVAVAVTRPTLDRKTQMPRVPPPLRVVSRVEHRVQEATMTLRQVSLHRKSLGRHHSKVSAQNYPKTMTPPSSSSIQLSKQWAPLLMLLPTHSRTSVAL